MYETTRGNRGIVLHSVIAEEQVRDLKEGCRGISGGTAKGRGGDGVGSGGQNGE